MRPTLAALAAVLLAGCGGSPRARPSPSVAASPSTAPAGSGSPSAAARGPVVAVPGTGRVDLYTVDESVPRLVQWRTIAGPPGAKHPSVALSGGADPTACVVWDASIACYPAGRPAVPVTSPERPTGAIAVSVAGDRVAWVGGAPRQDPALFYARLGAGGVAGVHRIAATTRTYDPEDAGLGVGDIAWAGDDALVVSSSYDDDVNASVQRVPLTSRAWADTPSVGQTDTYPLLYGTASSSATTRVLLAQSGFEWDDPHRAVEMDVATGRVVSVVAVGAARRRIAYVTGGPRGVLYVTEGFEGDRRVYWRRPGEPRGRPLAGVPAGDVVLLAQS